MTFPVDSSGTIWITTHDLAIGLAKRACPYCSTPVLIRLPSMQQAIDDKSNDAALKLGMDFLTEQERLIFNAVYQHYPRAVDSKLVEVAVNLDIRALDQAVVRMRKKLLVHGWLLVRRNRSLRLVEPQHIVGY